MPTFELPENEILADRIRSAASRGALSHALLFTGSGDRVAAARFAAAAMGKFDGVLLASDFDNTLIYTEEALRSGAPVPELSAENRRALEYFMCLSVPVNPVLTALLWQPITRTSRVRLKRQAEKYACGPYRRRH